MLGPGEGLFSHYKGNMGNKGAFKYYISTLGGVGGKSHLLILLMWLGGVGGLEAKCLCKRSEFLSICKLLLSLQNIT